MGVLNVTPDSFFDGNRYPAEAALRRIDELLAEGAWVIDIGAESTRPGARAVEPSVQIERLEAPVRYAVAKRDCWVSVDTTEPSVADAALSWGAHIINDVSCLRDAELASVVARHQKSLILMHARGRMSDLAGFSAYPEQGYDDVVSDVIAEWRHARDRAEAQGLSREAILFDPGIGFAKSAQHSMALVRHLRSFAVLEAPIVVGPSRKSFFDLVQPGGPESRLGSTVACCLHVASHGAALVRVHDAHVVYQALRAARYFRGESMSGVGHEPRQEKPCSMA